MRYLNFSEDFMEKIKRGEKHATLRLGVKNYIPGELVIVRCGSIDIGVAEIENVQLKKFKELSKRDAYEDGFATLEALKDALHRFYGDISSDTIFTQIKFRLCEIY